MIVDRDFKKASPIYWKSKQIELCHSSMLRLLDDAMYTARKIETLLNKNYQRRIPVKLFTDSESTLKLIVSSKKIDRKSLRMIVKEMKDRLIEGEVTSYQWMPTDQMWADALTKELEIPEGLQKLIANGNLDMEDKELNICQ